MGKEILRVTDPTFSNTALPMNTDWNFNPICVPVSTSKLHSQWYVGQFPYTGRLLFLLKSRRKQREKEELKTKQTVITTTAKKKKEKQKKTTQPSALSNARSQPNSLGLLWQAVFPSKWKERQQRTEIKASCSVMRYLHRRTWGACYFRSARVCRPTPALTHSGCISLHWH